MKFNYIISLLTILTILGGCATGYKSSGYSGGYSETQLSPNIFEVNFTGNGYTKSERAKNFALLRSAELTLENGFKYFQIIDANTKIEKSAYTTPVQAHTSYNAYGSHTSFSGGKTTTYSKPSSANTILMLHDKPQDGSIAFDAMFLSNSIKRKYKIKDK